MRRQLVAGMNRCRRPRSRLVVACQHRFATRYIVDIAARCSSNAWQGRGGVEYSAGVAGGGSASASLRYPAIDVLRGLALISMVSTHFDDLQQATFVGRILHSALWIDGAFYFVALSGVVTGLVHRRVVERSGFHASAAKLVRRAGWLYLVHIALVLTILVVHNADPSRTIPDTPTWAQAGGVWSAVERILVLRLEPDFNNVLPMYVAFLLWAVLAVGLLRRGHWWAVAGVSVAVYVFGQTIDGLALIRGAFPLANWQLLFTIGTAHRVVVGARARADHTALAPRHRGRVSSSRQPALPECQNHAPTDGVRVRRSPPKGAADGWPSSSPGRCSSPATRSSMRRGGHAVSPASCALSRSWAVGGCRAMPPW